MPQKMIDAGAVGVEPGDGAGSRCVDAADRRRWASGERPATLSRKASVAERVLLDVAGVGQAFVDDRVEQSVQERHIRAGAEGEVIGGVAAERLPAGVDHDGFCPRFAAFLMKVAATGWLTVGLAPMTMITSDCAHAADQRRHVFEPIVSINAAMLEAWQSRVQ